MLPKCSVGRGLAVSRSCHLIMPPPGNHLPGAPVTLAPPHIVGAGTTICSWPIIKRTRSLIRAAPDGYMFTVDPGSLLPAPPSQRCATRVAPGPIRHPPIPVHRVYFVIF